MTSQSRQFGPFSLDLDGSLAVVVLDRPPVNAVDLATYRALHELTTHLASRNDVDAVVLGAPDTTRAWCGGADVNDFVDIDHDARVARYDDVTAALAGLHDLPVPVVAAVNGPAVGVGVLLAAVCDLRIAADDAHFSCPEVDYGLVAGSARLLNYLGVPEALVREMTFTGARVPAERLERCGFLNRTTPRHEVLAAATDLGRTIARKPGRALRARKATLVQHQEMGWLDAYRAAQAASADLVELDESRAGVDAFLGRS